MGFETLSRQRSAGIRFGRVAAALILLILGFNLFRSGVEFIRRGPLQVLSGSQTQTEYLSANLGAYATAMEAIKALPSGSKVLMLWETRSYYCLPLCDGDEIIDRWFHDSRLYGNIETILETWQLTGYTHLIYNRLGAEFIRQEDPHFLTEKDWEKLENLLNALPSPIEIGGSYQLYPLPKDNP